MKSSFWLWLSVLWLFFVPLGVPTVAHAGRESPGAVNIGDIVDISQFGRTLSGDDFVGVQWDNPRDVYEVRLVGIDKKMAESLRLQWWGSVWPDNGSGGWMRLDDPWNGEWVHLNLEPTLDKSGQLVFRFPPLRKEEWRRALDLKRYPNGKTPLFRRTLKLRVMAEGKKMPSRSRLIVLGNSRWRECSFDIETHLSHDGAVTGRLELTNGVLVKLQSLPAPRSVQIEGTSWKAQGVAGRSAGVRLRVLYVDNKDLNSNDLTRITVRFGDGLRSTGFSFVPQDVLKDGVMRVPSFATLVSDTSRRVTLANDSGPNGKYWRRPVRRRIQERPEMTRTTALKNIPRLTPARWIPLGVPSARQEFFVGPNGDWMIWALSLNTDNGRDAKRWSFTKGFGKERQWDKLLFLLDTRQQPKFDGGDRQAARRYLEDGSLPVVHVQWRVGPLHYHHSLMATILLGDYGDDVSRRGDETVVLLSRLKVTNTGDTQQAAVVNLRYSNNAEISLQDDGIIALKSADGAAVQAGLSALRGLISVNKPSGGGVANWEVQPRTDSDSESSAILGWQEMLKPKQTRSIYFKTSFVELLDAKELARLKVIDFEKEVQRVLKYWRTRLAKGMQIEVPDDAINNFYRANLWHNVITTDRDPETGLYNQGVATVRYRVFANETVMVARSMDMRGEHTEAERFLEPMLHYQGTEPLKGRFSTKEGAFHGAGQYTHGEYAMNHGFVLWGAADHYLMTRDRDFLQRVAAKLVKGCDFLISERDSTMSAGDSPRSPIHGLCPASSLEDVVEYQYWFATNAYFCLGMKRVGEALADINHPEARRITREAERYRRDIETAAREAATRAPVVRLRNGDFVPYVPSRVYQWRHLTEGWIREALYCSLHLAPTEVIPCHDPLITWMLDDLEDSIFFSWQSGYNVKDYESTWFEHGGVTLQPCLLDMPTAYMARNEIPAALRAFWNTYAVLVYPDTQCFAEWAPRFGEGGGPVYKTSDESRFIMWLRQLLVWENDGQLWFGRGIPREWLEDGKAIRVADAPTVFGVAGLTIRSEVNQGRIYAEVCPPRRNPPSETWLRLRHPQGCVPSRVLIDGRAAGPERIIGPDICLTPCSTDRSTPIQVEAVY